MIGSDESEKLAALEQKAFEAARELRAQGWSVIRNHPGGSGPGRCIATISKGPITHCVQADSHAEALWLAVQAVLAVRLQNDKQEGTLQSHNFIYDANGNMTSDGTNSYAWNAENKLLQITYPGDGNSTKFDYDALGRCAKITELTGGTVSGIKQLVWCSTQICEERDANGALTKQFFSLGQRNGGKTYFYSCDHLGSIRQVTDSAGNVVAQYSYSPFGERTKITVSGPDSDFGFAGTYHHARSGLNLTLFRAYHSRLGRWLSRDPLGESAGSNLYSYVMNNPLNAIDPLGLAGWVTINVEQGEGWRWGHTWIEFSKANGGFDPTVSYGAFPSGFDNAPGGVFRNEELKRGMIPTTSRTVWIDDAGEARLNAFVEQQERRGKDAWNGFQDNCASFAPQAWKAATGENIPTKNRWGYPDSNVAVDAIKRANAAGPGAMPSSRWSVLLP